MVILTIIILSLMNCGGKGSAKNGDTRVSVSDLNQLREEYVRIILSGEIHNLESKYFRFLDEPVLDGTPAILHFYNKGDFVSLGIFLEYGADINVEIEPGILLIDHLIRTRNEKDILALLDLGLDVYTADSRGDFYLFKIIREGWSRMIPPFLEKGFQILTHSEDGTTFMELVLEQKRFDLFAEYNTYPFMWSAFRNHPRYKETLLRFKERYARVGNWEKQQSFPFEDSELAALLQTAFDRYDLLLLSRITENRADYRNYIPRGYMNIFLVDYLERFVFKDSEYFPLEEYGKILFHLMDNGLSIESLPSAVQDILNKAYENRSSTILNTLIDEHIYVKNLSDDDLKTRLYRAFHQYDSALIDILSFSGRDNVVLYLEYYSNFVQYVTKETFLEVYMAPFLNFYSRDLDIPNFGTILFYLLDNGVKVNLKSKTLALLVEKSYSEGNYEYLRNLPAEINRIRRFSEDELDRYINRGLMDFDYEKVGYADMAGISIEQSVQHKEGFFIAHFIRRIKKSDSHEKNKKGFGEILFILLDQGYSEVYDTEAVRFYDDGVESIVLSAYKRRDTALLNSLWDLAALYAEPGITDARTELYPRRSGGQKELQNPIDMGDIYSGDRFESFEIVTSYHPVFTDNAFEVRFLGNRERMAGVYSRPYWNEDPENNVLLTINKRYLDTFPHLTYGDTFLLDDRYYLDGAPQYIYGGHGRINAVVSRIDVVYSSDDQNSSVVHSKMYLKELEVATVGRINGASVPLFDEPGGKQVGRLRHNTEVLVLYSGSRYENSGSEDTNSSINWIFIEEIDAHAVKGYILNNQVDFVE